MMLPIKKQFEPSLDPIEQIFQLETLSILKPTAREGMLKRDNGFFSTWKPKVFKFAFIPDTSLVCQVYAIDGQHLEQIINLMGVKLTKKCSEVDRHICFGFITPSNQKTLIALKSNRDCLKIFNEVSSAKKIFKNSMFISNQNSQSQREVEKRRITQNQQTLQLNFGSPISNTQQLLQKSESSYNFLSNKGQSNYDMVKKKGNSQQSEGVSFSSKLSMRQQFRGIEELKGFVILSQFQNGIIYQNEERIAKANLVIYSPESSKEILEKFYQLDRWNQRVKSFKYMTKLGSGVYKYFIQFHKNGCFSHTKYSEVIVSLSHYHDNYYFLLESASENQQNMSKKDWVDLKLSVKIKTKTNNPRQKHLYFSLRSSNQSQILVEFANQIKQFQNFIKSKNKVFEKVPEIRNQGME